MADQFGPVTSAQKAKRVTELFEEARGLLDGPQADDIVAFVPEFWQGAAAAFAEAAELRRKENEPASGGEPVDDETTAVTVPD